MANPKESDELELVRLTDCADNAEAALVQSLLEAEGLFVNLSGAHHRSLVTALGSHIRIDVWVQRKDVERAKTLLAEWERGELAPPDPEALAAEAEAAQAPEIDRLELDPEQVEAVRQTSDAQLDASARRRRRLRKLGAWLLLGPVVVMLLLLGVLKVVQFFRLDWVEVKRPAFEVRFPNKPVETDDQAPRRAGGSYARVLLTSYEVENDCRYELLLITPGFGDAAKEEATVSGLAQADAAKFAGPVTVRDTELQGRHGREEIGSGQRGGSRVDLRTRFLALSDGTLIQSMVCPEGKLQKADAEKFFSSLRLTGR